MRAEDIRDFVDARIMEHLPAVNRMVEYGVGLVTATSTVDRTCTVRLRGGVSAGWAWGEFEPLVGDRVRVAWVSGDKWLDAILGRTISTGGSVSSGGVSNLDGGSPTSVYGGTTGIDGGTP